MPPSIHDNPPPQRTVSVDTLETLQPLTVALLECVTPSEVVDAVVERGMAVLGARAGLVALISRDGQELEIVRASGYAANMQDRWGHFSLQADYPLSAAAREGNAQFLQDYADWQSKYPLLMGQIEHIPQAAVSLPLVARHRVFGAMHFSFAEAHLFDTQDRAFLEELARQCALSLERALLMEEVEKAREAAEIAQRRQEFMARVGELLGETLHYATRLDALAHLFLPTLADWATIDIRDTNYPHTSPSQLTRLVVAHRFPEKEAVMREVQHRFPAEDTPDHASLTVLQTGEPLLIPEITDEALEVSGLSAERLALVREIGIRSLLCMPLIARGRTLGVLTLGTAPDPQGSGRLFTPDDQALAKEVARRAAAALDNALLYEDAQRWIAERTASELRFRVLADAAPVLVWMSGTDTEYDWFNRTWLDFTGRTMEQEQGNGWAQAIHPDDVQQCLHAYLSSFEARQPFKREYRLRRHDGQYRWLQDHGVPLFEGEPGEHTFRGYIGSCTDITEGRETLQALQEANSRQRRFLREMLSGFTEGRLRLCFTPEELPAPLPLVTESFSLSANTLRLLRRNIESMAQGLEFPEERQQEIVTAAHEAGMNAVKYGGGGTAHLHADTLKGVVQVWIVDHGPGIAEDLIHRALEPGYTTEGFGHGMFFMQSCADRLYLLTRRSGTTVVLEKQRVPPDPAWLSPTR